MNRSASASTADSHVRYLRDRLSAKLGVPEEPAAAPKTVSSKAAEPKARRKAAPAKAKTPKPKPREPLRLSPPLAAPSAVRRVLRKAEDRDARAADRVKVTVAISSRQPKSSPQPGRSSRASTASTSTSLRDAVLCEARRPGSKTGRHDGYPAEPVTITRRSASGTGAAQDDAGVRRRSKRPRPEALVFSGADPSPRVIASKRAALGAVPTLPRAAQASPLRSPRTTVSSPRPAPLRPAGRHLSLVDSIRAPCRPSPPRPSPPRTTTSRPAQPAVRHWPASGPPGSSHFFEHLFLRDMASVGRSLSVAERARVFGAEGPPPVRRPASFRSEPSLDVYLQQKKPVSESRFRSLDRLRHSRSSSPPTRAVLTDRDHDFYSMVQRFESEERGCRSASEPPAATPGPPPPPLPADKASSRSSTLSRSPSHRRIQGARSSRRPAPAPVEGVQGVRVAARSSDEPKRRSLSLSSTDAVKAEHQDYQAYVLELVHSTKKSERFRELNEFYSKLERMGQLERTASTGDLRPRLRNEEIIDYDRWRSVRTKERAEEELQHIYRRLREDQRSKDLLFSTKDVVRWKGDRGLRVKDRSVEDLRTHFRRLSTEDASPSRRGPPGHDVYKPLWRGNSVVNLANSLKRTTASHRGRPVVGEFVSRSLDRKHLSRHEQVGGIGNRLWSSLSLEQVNALKNQLSEIYSGCPGRRAAPRASACEVTVSEEAHDPGHLYVRSNSLVSSEDLYAEILMRRQLRRAESLKADSIGSLSVWRDEDDSQPRTSRVAPAVGQVLSEAEKKRLSRTLCQEVMSRRRARSVMSPRETLGAQAAADAKVVGKWTPSSPRTCYSLELSDHGHGHDLLLVLDAPPAAAALPPPPLPPPPPPLPQQTRKQVKEVSRPAEQEARAVSASETESASSTASTRTVIRVDTSSAPGSGPGTAAVQSKVEYFESMESSGPPSLGAVAPPVAAGPAGPTAAPAALESSRASSAERTDLIDRRPASSAASASSPGTSRLSSSQSDLRELFGESAAGRQYAAALTAPAAPRARPPPPRHPRSASLESLLSPTASPDPTKYYRAYIRMVKGGDVRRLADRFESLDDLTYMCVRAGEARARARMARACRSDPDLARAGRPHPDHQVVVRGHEAGDVDWLRRRYEAGRAAKRTASSPVPRRPLEDRFMPHINVISKTASLQRRTAPGAAPVKEAAAEADRVHTGHVDRLRSKFESELSLLGQMFTSTPDVHELRDIAPFLGCRWVAHQYPEPEPEPPLSRSMSALDVERVRSPGRPPARPRPASASPTRRQPASILKQASVVPPCCRHHQAAAAAPTLTYDRFANQPFDPAMHRPVCRYQPVPPPLPPPEPRRPLRPAAVRRPWTALDYWWRHCTHHRPTVHFKESPHRYADSEVTIRYRSPVSAARAPDAGRPMSEQELSRRQAEAMRRLYQEERRRKYLHELQDISSRRHTDNFT
ncbi:uncharacterized protein LOC127751770 isoform X1 [Frankliniella occidentalis]|uniref:Uncharacterized protein LOC127751770 isoform X1 n=1 Tax=Frankliniella occidentalis TaxID=133901 RepID=A0A9C6X9X0_FRAOC|nr:uncharacterized protein LOC127751770 isoform X1 [Frankliniella occidentalis]